MVVALSGLIMLVMTAGALFISITNDYRSLFEEDNPQLVAFNTLEATYAASNRALIGVAARQGTIFTQEALLAIEQLTEAAWRTPHSTRVDSLTNYSHSEGSDDDLVVGPLVEDAGALREEDIARVEAVALNASEIAGRLVASDGRVAGVVVTFALPDDVDAATIEITDHLNDLLDEARASHPGLAYYLTGDVVMNRSFADATQNDLLTLSPIVLAIIVAITAILLRSAMGTLAIMIVLGFTVNTTVGFAGWDRNGYQPCKLRHADHRHDDRHCPLGSYCDFHPVGNEAGIDERRSNCCLTSR